MSLKNTLAFDDIENYYTSVDRTLECLDKAISRLKDLNRSGNSERDKEKNNRKIGELEQKIALVEEKRSAFTANSHSINPPSAPQLDSLRDLIAEVERLNTNQAIFNEIVQLSTAALTEFNNIHPNQGGN